ncbi:MAG: heme lyase CcmF/NrfE family subunit [Pseudomonadales bacterium]|nr:heme lyase CcmF/NrfE family subunit [Pseudomonadales bacterium]MDP6471970.1 heme lyase CcmF/NrfE family subunit [Pseudomonadales bacterium]MDP6826759.1 heme lyase CcmF/NrfE family subunit [Pseudomonadales bacterium]MDP6971010.1 heme lyase CcmF/NrfE family subunit [Pseudomonadales bacterium]
MIPELGQYALVLALCLAGAGAFAGLVGAQANNARWMRAARSLPMGQFVLTAIAFGVLMHAFVTDDFSVGYVARNSNSLLPWYYKVSAVWGAHEGSFLLWTLIMGAWMLAVSLRGHVLPPRFHARVLGVMSVLNLGFLAFLIFTSNPFDRLLPLAPLDGSDLNPLLQDFGLVLHPPLLYIGYVGFSVAFAFALAALLSGRLDSAWARWSRPWTNITWAFLTLGIALGSWWAYYELGWGGWWFWDPVENASFMPWLAGTALVHSLAVTEKRGTFRAWTLLLSVSVFSLSLLGAFIVRSGVLTSVHAFAVDPTRGMFILVFLTLVVGGSFALYAVRAQEMVSSVRYGWHSREMFLLVNNLLLVVALAVVLLGTLYPLAYEAVTGGDKISIGPPWFNTFFVPLMMALTVALGIGPLMGWKRTPLPELRRRLAVAAVASVLLSVAVALVVGSDLGAGAVLAVVLGLWVLATSLIDIRRRSARGLRRVPAAYWGMQLAHFGFAMALVGVALTHTLSVEKDLRLEPGEQTEQQGVTFLFKGVVDARGSNYVAQTGLFEITDGDQRLLLKPEKRRYLASNQVMTEAAIDAGLFRDLYVSLGEPLGEGAWAVRVYVKPFVRWIWYGCLLMALGGIMAVADARYRRLRVREASRLAAAGAAS